ncbi:MAG TPA: DUF4192 family protein [Candidatus Lumbricidophila sp.]|nr:DUF4192 family protein [Candidatus Lumbricidophila sp.]
MPTVIRASGAAEFLALLPSMLGYRPSNSVVAVVFRHGRTCGAMRYDLSGTDPATLAMVMVGVACRIEGADAVIPLVYTDRPYRAATAGAPSVMLGCLTQSLHEAGFGVPDAFLLAAGGWAAGMLVGESLMLPPEPEPYARVDEARVAAPEHTVVAHPAAIAEPDRRDPRRAAAVRRARRALELARPGAPAGSVHLPDDIARLAQLLTGGRGRPLSPTEIAVLGSICAHPADRDALLGSVALGSVESLGALGEQPRIEDLITGGSAVPVDVGRLANAHAAFRHAIAHLPRRQRPGPLGLAGWLCWAQGQGSAAIAHLTAALEIDPDHTLALVLQRLVCEGRIPEWAFQPPISDR